MRKKAPLCKGSWPTGPEGLSFPLHETRRNSLAKENCNTAIGCATGAHPRAGGRMPPTGCRASGENGKKPAGNFTFLTGFFLRFHYARGAVFRLFTLHAETTLFDTIVHRKMGAGMKSLPQGYRGRGAPCSGGPHRPGLHASYCSITKAGCWERSPLVMRRRGIFCTFSCPISCRKGFSSAMGQS